MALGADIVQRMKPGHLVQHFLLASFAYYHCNESPMTDGAFDALCKRLLDCYDDVVHQHKYLIDKDMLRAGSGYNLRWDDYPKMVQVAVIGGCGNPGYTILCESGEMARSMEPYLLPDEHVDAPVRIRRTRATPVPSAPPPAAAVRRITRSRPKGNA